MQGEHMAVRRFLALVPGDRKWLLRQLDADVAERLLAAIDSAEATAQVPGAEAGESNDGLVFSPEAVEAIAGLPDELLARALDALALDWERALKRRLGGRRWRGVNRHRDGKPMSGKAREALTAYVREKAAEQSVGGSGDFDTAMERHADATAAE